MMDDSQQHSQMEFKNSERVSAHTDCTENEDREEDLLKRYTDVETEDIRFYRVNLIADNGAKKPSAKLNRSAVGWIQATCFVRGLDLQATSLAVALYYAHISMHTLDKSRLECILASAVFLAQKFCSPRTLASSSLAELTSGKFAPQQVLEVENELLHLFDMDLIVETVFDFVADEGLPSHVEGGVFFLIELLLLKDASILFDEDKVRVLVDLVEDPIHEGPELAELRELLNCRQVDTLRKKYMSLLEVDQLIHKLQALPEEAINF